jgi:hypothetical protein
MLASRTSAGVFDPTLPAAFESFAAATGESVVQNAGASAGVIGGQVEGIGELPVAGAINRVLPVPNNPNILYVGAVNGGVWKTMNAQSQSPFWTPLTDNMPSLSIGAMAFDRSDPTFNTIVVGIGSQSSDGRLGGLHMGVLRTTDAGATWTNLGVSELYGYRIAGISAYGSTISVCAVGYGLLSGQLYQNGATFYSTDTGNSWTMSNTESCTDMVADAIIPTTVFRASLQLGITYSTDSGVNWKSVVLGNPTYPQIFSEQIKNIRMSVRNIGDAQTPKYIIYAGFLSKTLQGLYRGEGVGENWTWTPLDTPKTNDNGTINGLNPVFENNPGEGGNADNHHYFKPGGQGTIHFSIVGDISSNTIVYVGGDRQPTGGNATNPSWPNGIGAYNYDGRLFRCDSSKAPGSQCTPLTHDFAANNSAPHADSRDMMFDASGRIIESDDGGVYYRTAPQTVTGAWGSLLGNLQVQEAQGAAYIGNGMFATGNQDTGTTYGLGGGNTSWVSLGQGDGGVPRAGVFENGTKVLYWSYPFFGGFSQTFFSATGEELETQSPELLVNGTENSLQGWVTGQAPPVNFYQDYLVNSVDPSRLLFVFNFDRFAYESFDGGNTLYPVIISASSPGQTGNGAAVYGGVLDGQAHANLTYAAGLNLLAKRDLTGKWSITNWPPVGIRWPTIAHVAAHPQNWQIVAVLGAYGEVAISKDAGATWSTLPALQVGVWGMPDSQQRRIVVLPGAQLRIVVGGRTGVYVYQDSAAKWWRLGGWPNAFVNDMGYDAADDLLWASTLGRSVWKVAKASTVFTEEAFAAAHPPQPTPPRAPKVPNWVTLTYVFAALTVVLFLSTVVFGIAFLTTKLKDPEPSVHQALLSEE